MTFALATLAFLASRYRLQFEQAGDDRPTLERLAKKYKTMLERVRGADDPIFQLTFPQRGMLAPGSDIDLLFLLPYKQTAWGESVAEASIVVTRSPPRFRSSRGAGRGSPAASTAPCAGGGAGRSRLGARFGHAQGG